MNLQSLTIDSREVAEMVEKDHKHLLRDIDNYVQIMESPTLGNGLTVHVTDFFVAGFYVSNDRQYRRYLVTRKGCEMVANKMTGTKGVLFTAAYVNKFHEMEVALVVEKFNLPRTYSAALRELADVTDEKEELQRQNQIMAPKAAAHDQFMSGKNSQPMNVVAKSLDTGRTRLFAFLRDHGILMSNNTPYQKFIDSGYFEVVEKPIKMGDDTINKPQTLVTPKGMGYIGKLLKRSNTLTLVERTGG
jgi:phage regulator Rha-like protein